jgi:hypothetical protein
MKLKIHNQTKGSKMVSGDFTKQPSKLEVHKNTITKEVQAVLENLISLESRLAPYSNNFQDKESESKERKAGDCELDVFLIGVSEKLVEINERIDRIIRKVYV